MSLGRGAGLAPVLEDLGQKENAGLDGESEAALVAAAKGLGTAQAQPSQSDILPALGCNTHTHSFGTRPSEQKCSLF